jgi:hypothetical protein
MLTATGMQAYYQAVSSKTFFSNIQLFEIGKPTREMFFTNARMEEREDGWGGALQVVGFGGQTTNSAKLNSYFMPYGKCSLNVIEGIPSPGAVYPADGTTNRDIEARNFNLVTVDGAAGEDGLEYQGVITFNPKQTIAGIGFEWKQALWRNCEGVPTIWGEISFPVQYVKNEMNLCENVTQKGGGASPTTGLDGAAHVGTMQAAFAQPAMLYGKVDNSKNLSKWGVADVEIRIGYNSFRGECCDLNAYFGIVAPTGTKIDQCNAAYMFNSVIGNNHHFGILYGTHFGFGLYEKGNHDLRMELDMSSKYLFSNHQWRSFDLVQEGEWSRYLEIYSNVAQATAALAATSNETGSFGINEFTRKLRVTPRFATNINLGLNYSYKHFDVEVGYNLFTRQAEKVEFPRNCCVDFPLTIAVKDINGDGQTNLARTIKNDFPGSATVLAQYANNIIQLPNLNLDSAAHPATLSHTIYGGLAYNSQCLNIPWFVGVGGMYEFCSMNSSLDRWNVLGKFGISY